MKDADKSKGEKGTEETDEKDEPKIKYSKEAKEKRKSEEPPRHPGFILQTKWSKGSKVRPLSLSLDSLLDYTEKDIEESTFELSLFAESLYEMLQYQMGCRILTFLQKLRIKFVMKRTQRKRMREDDNEKENAKNSPIKRLKGDDPLVKSEPAELDTSSTTLADKEKSGAEDDSSDDKEDVVKMEDGTDEEEEPEEDPEEYEETENESIQRDSSSEKNVEQKTNLNIESHNIAGNEKAADETNIGEAKGKETTESKSDIHFNDEKEGKVNKNAPAVKEIVVDKELLQAFRFFDRNRVGFIMVEDMRLIIHSSGKFLSHRDVKELVQSALLESKTGRDDRILYNKLVRMNDI